MNKFVASKHMPPRPSGATVCIEHKDGVKTNDSADNMVWSDRAGVVKAARAATTKHVYRLSAWGAGQYEVKYTSVQAAAEAESLKVKASYYAINRRSAINGQYLTYTEPGACVAGQS